MLLCMCIGRRIRPQVYVVLASVLMKTLKKKKKHEILCKISVGVSDSAMWEQISSTPGRLKQQS